MTQYGKVEYWEDRYTRDPEPFDWYQRYSGLRSTLSQYITKDMNILNIGCGNSRLSEDMFDDGYTNIDNIDISRTVITAMQEKFADKGMTFDCMDVRKLTYADRSYHAVLDKGTLDSVLCGENSTENVDKMLSEVARVLSDSGVYVLISYGTPDTRLNFLEKPEYGWTVNIHTIAKPSVGTQPVSEDMENSAHYFYACMKGGKGYR